MFLWLWRAIRIYHFYFTHTHTHTSVFGTLERSIERNSLGQMLKSVNVARTPESERERRE